MRYLRESMVCLVVLCGGTQGSAEADAEADPQLMRPQPAYEPGCGMLDSCCGMSEEGCCMGGQQCYTYYENVCENVNKARCNMRGRKVCEQVELPDCRLTRETSSLVMYDEVCRQIPNRQCFEYNKTVCSMTPVTQPKLVSWENQKLKKTTDQFEEKCEDVKRCNFTTENRMEVKTIPERICDNRTLTQELCRNVPVTDYTTEERLDWVVQYKTECQLINQPACSTNACSPSGCTNGGSVCSNSDFNTTTVCPQQVGGGQMGGGCQEVQMPVCYGNGGACNNQYQQCCYNEQRQVCRQVPQRVPIQRNVTLPLTRYEKDCKNVDYVTQDCRTEYKYENITIPYKKCNEIIKHECVNITMPQYSVVNEVKNETVKFSVILCNRRQEKVSFCKLVLGDIECKKKPVTKRYLVNKVVCDRRRTVEFCTTIPESECQNDPVQVCKVVPRQVCQPACSESPKCNQCESFRREGGFSNCDSGMCPNFYPQDSYFNTSSGMGGGGYNPGEVIGGGGYYPGEIIGGGGYNPGEIIGGGGYNPGEIIGGGGYNPGNNFGDGSYGSVEVIGGGGYNPGQIIGGGGYNPGQMIGGGGYNPGQNFGSGSYNPGQNIGGGGYNPGNYGNGGGYNPGNDRGYYSGQDSGSFQSALNSLSEESDGLEAERGGGDELAE